jgi:hypothetical protein
MRLDRGFAAADCTVCCPMMDYPLVKWEMAGSSTYPPYYKHNVICPHRFVIGNY